MRWVIAVVLCCVVCSVRSLVEEDEAFLRIMARRTVYNAGERKAIFCTAKNIEDPMEWLSPAGKKIEIRSSINSRVYVEPRIKNESDDFLLMPLIIRETKISDSGNWMCKAGNYSDNIDIIVGEKANIPERNVSMEGHEGKSVRLTCEARGYPTPVVIWYRENVQIHNDTKHVIRADNSLEINQLDHTDVGFYVCKVKQEVISHVTDKTVYLTVQHTTFTVSPLENATEYYNRVHNRNARGFSEWFESPKARNNAYRMMVSIHLFFSALVFTLWN